MRGSIVRRHQNSYYLVLELGREKDPATGRSKRRQKWITFRGKRKAAETKLTELCGAADNGMFVEPTKITLIEWMRTWLDDSVKPPLRRPETYRVYKCMVEVHLAKSTLANRLLHELRASHLERYYAELDAKASTVHIHHAVIRKALADAVKARLLRFNVATEATNRPRMSKDRAVNEAAHCWTATEARRVLDAANEAGPQTAAFFTLALETGARKSEIHGLQWQHVHLDKGEITIAQQLEPGKRLVPTFGPTKTDRRRDVRISTNLIALLRDHKRTQAALKLRNRTTYADHDLVFAKEPNDLTTPGARLGQPVTMDKRPFRQVITAAGVRPIKFHGLRHTSATLSLQAGTPVHVVAKRLGHSKTQMTLEVYAHALPDQQGAAADSLSAVLGGSRASNG